MNSGQYRHQPQNHGLPLDYPYGDSLGSSMQSTQQMVSFDGSSRSQPDQAFVVNPSATLPVNSFGLTSPMTSLPQSSTIWSDPNNSQMSFDDQTTTNNYYGYSAVVTSSEQDNSLVRGINFAGVPRTWPPYDPRMLNNTDVFEHSYMMEPEKSNVQNTSDEDPFVTKARSYVRMSMSQSPKVENDHQEPHLSPTKETGDSDDGGRSSRELTAMDVDEHTADEPYAKLIHRALMSVPSHSMVLQEIYQWFRENTGKGNGGPESKGWMNSIRHNLSMNAAFKKTERKLPGDDTKKSTEWVLEDFAIKDGVQSTTRYRKGTGAKRFMRSDNPTPSRQSSGRKGGISAYKMKMQRRAVRDRNDPRRSLHRHDILCSQYSYPAQAGMQRHSSPSTPPNNEMAGPTPYFLPKTEPVEQPFDEVVRGLQDVQGVYHDDAPLFTHQHHGHYYDGLPSQF
ncbi:hypothetical protein HYFRA_00012208 [Hymenoscyphus fraxineus]|uniref:Fork-head domain-containing protein n=1 Tax=Hymenoscyphus fraxineus TaxID=746836 RepID=A0A9N9L037_9HELO|nr:hypothetical protein HYFRA_00012208 [Hymenoscyphus fraxineus]